MTDYYAVDPSHRGLVNDPKVVISIDLGYTSN